jgi:hypothetical protein
MKSSSRLGVFCVGLLVAGGAFVAIAPPVWARLGFGGGCSGNFCVFDTPAVLSADGLRVLTGVVFACDPNVAGWKLQVSVTQESTLASAQGLATGPCNAEGQDIVVESSVRTGGSPFEPGTVLACGLILTGNGSNIAHANHWCRFIRLQR